MSRRCRVVRVAIAISDTAHTELVALVVVVGVVVVVAVAGAI